MRRSWVAVLALGAALAAGPSSAGGGGGGGSGGGHGAGGHTAGGHGHGQAGRGGSCAGAGGSVHSGGFLVNGSYAADAGHSTRRERNEERAAFRRQDPCPATGQTDGRCPGFRIDLIVPREKGGGDHAWNMRWQLDENRHGRGE